MNHYAETYLVIEDRRPIRYEINGTHVISGCYATKDAALRAAAGKEARVLPIRVNLSPGFFNTPRVVIQVPENINRDTGEVKQ